MQTEGPLGDAECPICQTSLSHLRSSFQRQQHVEQCLSGGASTDLAVATATQNTIHENSNVTGGGDGDFDYCIFCGKCITHLQGIRKDVHFSKCLDTLAFEERAESNASFAGQSIPVLDNLDICPCCHEFAPMRDKSLRHKITHMKQCIKRRGMSMQSLLQKLQWIQWDYMPERRNNNKPPPPPPPTARRMPQTVIQATRSAADFRGSSSHGINNSSYMDNDDDDDDFVDSVIVHRKTIQEQQSKRARRNDNSEQDAMDEELQLALTLSRTEAQQNKRKKINHDATDIITIDESRRLASLQLEQMLARKRIVRCSDTKQTLPSSRVKATHRIDDDPALSLWKLASLDGNHQYDDPTFISHFLRMLKQGEGSSSSSSY